MKEEIRKCAMIEQGFSKGACDTTIEDGSKLPACQSTLKYKTGQYYRVITSMHLSRPEDYFSIYQSGCNHHCVYCHSHYFAKHINGEWCSTGKIALKCKEYENQVTVIEPRKHALMYYATDLCKHCGSCVIFGKRGPLCPNKISKDKVIVGPQGFGPARNIAAFTGGDIACQANFYAEVTRKIKSMCDNMWVLLETNGYGCTPKNLDLFQKAGVDSYWLDIKAYDEDIYKKLCGTSNKSVLKSPKEIIKRNFVIEVLTVYIPGFVEIDQFKKIAELIVEIDETIPFHILCFFPQYELMDNRIPNLNEILETYKLVKNIGLKKVRIGNTGIIAPTEDKMKLLIKEVGLGAL